MKKKTAGGKIPIVTNPTKQKVLSSLIQHLCRDEDGMLVCVALREALVATTLRTMDERSRSYVFNGFNDGGLAWELKRKGGN
jgi:hypothetical protein